jgi:hypothetical protein
MKERLSRYDAVQALIRNPQYLKDYDKAFGGLRKKKRFSLALQRNFLKKYHLVIPLDPRIWKKKSRRKIEAVALFDESVESRTVEVQNPIRHKAFPLEDLEEKKKWVSGSAPEDTRNEDINCAIIYFDYPKKFLFLKIDLSALKKDILYEVEWAIDYYSKNIKRCKERNRPEKVDKFSIWDECTKTGSPSETAKKLGLDESTVLKAYHRAQEMIEKILDGDCEPKN